MLEILDDDVDLNFVRVPYLCRNCHTTWIDVYKFVSTTNIESILPAEQDEVPDGD